MIVFRRRGWIAVLLAIVATLGPAFVFHERRYEMCIAMATLLLSSAMFVYWFGTRSMREAERHLERPLRIHERVFDFWSVSPFDSFTYVHLRWWALAFAAGAVFAGVKAYE
jgi:hypothetical protein